jgi:hypothetical protein
MYPSSKVRHHRRYRSCYHEIVIANMMAGGYDFGLACAVLVLVRR